MKFPANYEEMLKMPVEDLRELNSLVVSIIKDHRRAESLRIATKLRVGDKVRFRDKHGRLVVGMVTKINTKTADVLADDTRVKWSVSLTLLEGVL